MSSVEQVESAAPAPRRWPVAMVIMVVLAAIGLQVGGAFEPRTDAVTTIGAGESFITGPFELQVSELTIESQEYQPEEDLVSLTIDARTLDTAAQTLGEETLWLVLPDGSRANQVNIEVGIFSAQQALLQPRMPMRPVTFSYEIPAGAVAGGDVVQIEVATLVLRHDALRDHDTWVPSGQITQVSLTR